MMKELTVTVEEYAQMKAVDIRTVDPSQIILAPWEKLCFGMLDLAKRKGWNCT